MCPGKAFLIMLTTSSPGASVFDLRRIPPLSPTSSNSILSVFVIQKKMSSKPEKTKQVHYKMTAHGVLFHHNQRSGRNTHHNSENDGGTHFIRLPSIIAHYQINTLLFNDRTEKNSITLLLLLHKHEHKILVSLFRQICLHNCAGVSVSVGNSQSSRRRTRGNSIASKASPPNDTECSLAKQAPFLHSQILIFTVCIPPLLCRSLTST